MFESLTQHHVLPKHQSDSCRPPSVKRRGRMVAVAAAALAASACGGGGDVVGSAAVSTTVSTATTSTTAEQAPISVAAAEQTRATDCPDLGDSIANVNAATYAVYGEAIVNGDTGPELVHFQIGTAWAVDRRLLVTNAHVTQAFVEFAEQGAQLERALAIQAGTGTVVELLQEVTHPDYSGDPLTSPDIGLFSTRDELPVRLELADDDVKLELGEEVQIVGFPGDVTDFIEIVPGETVPQATSLNGQITALRSHDDTATVDNENVDVIQHQAPTTPGTSGSSIVACGKVIGINNAGTVNLIATPSADGSLTIDRQAAAANNFGVHVHHIREMLELFDDGALVGEALPIEAVRVDVPSEAAAERLLLQGEVGDPYAHTFVIEVLDDGSLVGTSDWEGNAFQLQGTIFEDGSILLVDDAYEASDGQLLRGIYEAVITGDDTIEGIYYEEGAEDAQAPFVAQVLG
ncbi:MAG: serine protease [Acidimicrobiales bacterium]